MQITLSLNGNASPAVNYVGWAPCPAQIQAAGMTAGAPVNLVLQNERPAGPGGQVVFWSAHAGQGQNTLALVLPADGTPVTFVVGGKFGNPSVADGDAAIQATDLASGAVLSVTRLM